MMDRCWLLYPLIITDNAIEIQAAIDGGVVIGVPYTDTSNNLNRPINAIVLCWLSIDYRYLSINITSHRVTVYLPPKILQLCVRSNHTKFIKYKYYILRILTTMSYYTHFV